MNLMINQINYGLLKEENLIINYNVLMYSTHNQDKSVIADRFIKTLKSKTYKGITANDSKSYLPYLNNLVDQ